MIKDTNGKEGEDVTYSTLPLGAESTKQPIEMLYPICNFTQFLQLVIA